MRKTKLVAVWVLALTGAGAVQGQTLGNETGGTLLSAAKPTTYATSTDATGGEYTDCRPSAPQITFEHGYTVSVCIEYERDGELVQADAFDFGLGSRESGLLYFFDADNAEVLIKVLDACAVNNHRWVFVAAGDDAGVQPARRRDSDRASRSTCASNTSEMANRCLRRCGTTV